IRELSALADRMVKMGDRAAAERLVNAIYMVGDMVAATGLCQTTSRTGTAVGVASGGAGPAAIRT
ncbi:MAG: hypothetical protein ACREFT_15425, partial [Acetobacteraceae bacterium]